MSEDITLPLDDFIICLMGKEQRGTVYLTKLAGIILAEKLNKGTRYYVQLMDRDDNELDSPILWSYNDWRNSNNNYWLNKKYQHKLQIESALREENIKRATRAIVKLMSMDFEHAQALANVLVRKGKVQNLLALGVSKVLTKEEEL